MNYLVLTDSYAPKINSGAIIVGDLVSELIRSENNVVVVTFHDDLKKIFDIEKHLKLTIIRIKIKNRNKSRFHRALAEMSYSNKIISVLRKTQVKDFDRIICYSPSIFFGKAIKWLKREKPIKAYLIIRDIFPKWALDAGLLRRGVPYYFFKFIEKQLYSSVDFLGIESKSDLNYFSKYIDKKRQTLEVLNNWSSPLDISKIESSSQYIDSNYTNIVYGGNISEAQDLLSLIKDIDTEKLIKNKIKITIMGDGQQKRLIEEYIKKNNLECINLVSSKDRYTYLTFLSNADAGLISLNKDLLSHNYPLKMLSYIQLGKPVLASVNPGNEILDFFNQNPIGLASVAGDRSMLNKNILRLALDKKERAKFGSKAMSIFNKEFTVHSTVEKIGLAFEK